MQSAPIHTSHFTPATSSPPGKQNACISVFSSSNSRAPYRRTLPLLSATRTPKGFGPKDRQKKRKKDKVVLIRDSDDEDDEYDDETKDEMIPEVVTNRMMRRMGVSVGVPVVTGLLFFPFFYYLKVVLKVDVPNWIPFIVSFAFFGSALLGVSYGIVSSSWDPMREGSLLGWNEAQKNWPVFWQSIRGGSESSK